MKVWLLRGFLPLVLLHPSSFIPYFVVFASRAVLAVSSEVLRVALMVRVSDARLARVTVWVQVVVRQAAVDRRRWRFRRPIDAMRYIRRRA